jgi:FlaG/FlaF family flagellin (archaellin)
MIIVKYIYLQCDFWHGDLIPVKSIRHCNQWSLMWPRGILMSRNVLRKTNENAVSPVVGVMLMLVVTIIIAAVVSGFSGGVFGTTQKAPTAAIDVKIVNTGFAATSGFYANVLGTSQAIPTRDLKIVTSWQTTIKDNAMCPNLPEGQVALGGNTTVGNGRNVLAYVGMQTNDIVPANAPFAMGPGITGPPQNTYGQNPTDPFGKGDRQWQWFGNYSLVDGTGLYALPAPYNSGQNIGGLAGYVNTTEGGYGGVDQYSYSLGGVYFDTGQIDATSAVLGTCWENLRPGDVVSVKIIHVPSGKAVYQKDVAVTEG